VDDARAIAERARQAGVDVTLEIEPDMLHAWMIVFGGAFEVSRATLERMGRFVTEHQAAGEAAVRRVS
jgi:acetyl esterase/lipase